MSQRCRTSTISLLLFLHPSLCPFVQSWLFIHMGLLLERRRLSRCYSVWLRTLPEHSLSLCTSPLCLSSVLAILFCSLPPCVQSPTHSQALALLAVLITSLLESASVEARRLWWPSVFTVIRRFHFPPFKHVRWT